MDIEKLIESVSNFPVLYDQSHEKYRNSDYKDRIWREIASTLEGDVEECKKKWSSIRDQLRRTLQKRKTKSGQAASKARKYKYEDILTFLTPCLGEGEDLSNKSNVNEEESFEFGNNSHGIPTQDSIVSIVVDESQENTNVSLQSPESSSDTNFAIPASLKRKLPGHGVKSDGSAASQLVAYILAEIEKEMVKKSNRTESQDSVDAFLGGIAPTLKTLDPILLNEVKGKIFMIVQEAELKQLQWRR